MFAKRLGEAEASGPQITSHLRVKYILEDDDLDTAIRLLLVDIPVAKAQLSGSSQIAPLLAVAKIFADRDPTLAAVLLGILGPQYLGSGIYHTPRERKWYDRLVEQLRGSMGEDALTEELQRGATLTPEQALQLAFDAVCRLAP